MVWPDLTLGHGVAQPVEWRWDGPRQLVVMQQEYLESTEITQRWWDGPRQLVVTQVEYLESTEIT